MKIPNVEHRHMTRASDAIIKLKDLKEFLIKENPGLIQRLEEQQISLYKDKKTIEQVSSFTTGFYACWFLIREALKDEELN